MIVVTESKPYSGFLHDRPMSLRQGVEARNYDFIQRAGRPREITDYCLKITILSGLMLGCFIDRK